MGWSDVHRAVEIAAERLDGGEAPEDFQAVGRTCNEALISLGDTLFDEIADELGGDELPSRTHAEEVLNSYLATRLPGKTHIKVRGVIRALWGLSNDTYHKRPATYQQAAICFEATSSLVRIVSIIAEAPEAPAPRRQLVKKFGQVRERLQEYINEAVELSYIEYLKPHVDKCTEWHAKVEAFVEAALTPGRAGEFRSWHQEARRNSLGLHQTDRYIRDWLKFYAERLRQWVNGQLTENDVNPGWELDDEREDE